MKGEATAYDKIFKADEPGTPIESVGAWTSLTKGLGFKSEDELADYVRDKKILDVGSGMGGLFKEAQIKGINAEIINLNPRFAIADHRVLAHETYEKLYETHTGTSLPTNIAEINSLHDKSAVSALADKLPFVEESFDVVIDHKGAVYHLVYEDTFDDIGIVSKFRPNKKILEFTLAEYMRVLKPGGTARIGGLLPHVPEAVEFLINVLDERKIPYRLVETDQEETAAIEIVKPLNTRNQEL